METYYIVKYKGAFGFIKPWTAVRDSETFSQPFLTPSIVEGMRQKLEVSAILRHRLHYSGISKQQEVTQPADWEVSAKGKAKRAPAILTRGVLLYPTLHLAFGTLEEAELAAIQHLCLCRNEDLIYPVEQPILMSADEFNGLPGVELEFVKHEDSFIVGYNRFAEGSEMYGRLIFVDENA